MNAPQAGDRDSTPEYFVYLARCANGTFYVGETKDVTRRIQQHNAGSGGRYTRRNRPLALLASWPFPTLRDARQYERHLKRLRHEQKQALVNACRGESSHDPHRPAPAPALREMWYTLPEPTQESLHLPDLLPERAGASPTLVGRA